MIPNDVSNSSSVQLFANFDSGNMLRYERVTSSMSSSSQVPPNLTEADSNNNNNNPGLETTSNTISHPLPKHDVEFNVWTKRDCEGLVKVNGNRSWFYFGVKGGYGKCIRFNIMNLNRQARLFEMGMLPVFRTVPGHEKWSRIYIRPCWETVNEDFKLSFIHRMADMKASTTFFAFCFPHSYEDMQTLLNTYDISQNSHLADHHLEHPSLPVNSSDIYYHRETLCYSCDGNKLDLITITSYKGITKEREHVFDRKLFPDASTITKRPHQFRNKRIFFLSSRVHPGETPAAFVFLGFVDFILKGDDPRARLLRDLYIFKLVPILNPDGVQRGHYRTDQFGVNLNRMYLDPDFEKHPSIYAAKSLIAYHHVNNCISPRPVLSIYDIFKDVIPPDQASRQSIPIVQNNEQGLNDRQFPAKSTPRQTDLPSEFFYETPMINSKPPNHNAFESLSLDEQMTSDENRPFFLERSENGFTPAVTHKMGDTELQQQSPYSFHYVNENLELHRDLFRVDHDDEDEGNLRNQIKGNEGSDEEDDIFSSTQNNENGVHEAKSPHLANPDLLKISPYESGIAYYIDLHGHASKKGCFIYGNHLPDDEQQTDNMLFTKLISLNSPHFDYDSCNFTIKNMYMKDKREGLSKEGSGRVALNKHFGILHSYTLECSYAVGKSCNSISAAESEAHGGRISPATPFTLPPKFTIDHYRDVGKACALAAIDILPGRNPFTRVNQSTFKTIHALRDYVKHQIRQQRNRIGNSRNISSTIPSTTSNRVKQQQYMARVTQTYRTTNIPANSTSAVTMHHQQLQMTSSFPTATSAPPTSTAASRITASHQLSRMPATASNQQTSSRFKPTYDNRRYSNTQTPYKRSSQLPASSNTKVAPVLSRIEVGPLPSARLVLQQQVSSPGRLQHPQQSPSSSQFLMPSGSILDPLVVVRNRPAPLPPPTVRNAMHRNAVSLNTLPVNHQNGAMIRGRSQSSAHKASVPSRTTKIRQQSLAPFDLQQPPIPYSSATVIYRHPLSTDSPPVFFE